MKKTVKLSNVAYKLDKDAQDDIKDMGIDIDTCEVVRKSFGINGDIQAINKSDIDKEDRTCIRYVSTRDVDEIGDVIIPKGVDVTLFEKRGSPIFFNHDYSIPQIGKADWIKKDQNGIKVKQRYARSEDKGALCNYLFELVQQGMNSQSSVGIIPTEVIRIGDPDFKSAIKALSKEWPEFKKQAKSCRRIITKCLLFEHSDVGLGCNASTSIVSKTVKILTDAGADEKLLKQLGLPIPVKEGSIEFKADSGNEGLGAIEFTPEAKEKLKKLELLNFNGEEVEIEEKVSDIDPFTDDYDDVDKDGKPKEVEVEEKTPETPVEETETPVEEVKEEKAVKSKVYLVQEPRTVKLVHKPAYRIDENEIKETISAEIRKKRGMLL